MGVKKNSRDRWEIEDSKRRFGIRFGKPFVSSFLSRDDPNSKFPSLFNPHSNTGGSRERELWKRKVVALSSSTPIPTPLEVLILLLSQIVSLSFSALGFSHFRLLLF